MFRNQCCQRLKCQSVEKRLKLNLRKNQMSEKCLLLAANTFSSMISFFSFFATYSFPIRTRWWLRFRRLLRLHHHVTTNTRNIILTKPKSAFGGIFDPTLTLALDFLTPKFDAFNPASMFVSGESLVKYGQKIRQISCQQSLFGTHARTDTCTHEHSGNMMLPANTLAEA